MLICLLATLYLGHIVHAGVPSLKWLSDAKKPVTNVYLDFDSTITVDGFSEVVRNAFCNTEEYPDCKCGSICDDPMVCIVLLCNCDT